MINKSNHSLIILDWDDTLFPTTWVLKEKINLKNDSVKNKYIVFFSKLDQLLYRLLINFMKHGEVVIVTNAMIKWVNISADILPYTKKLINKKIKVISAREAHGDKYPKRMFIWKKLIFKDLSAYKNYKNIISIGDAEYEFKALINLWNKKNNRNLKTIRFIKSPSYDALIDQLQVLINCLKNICEKKQHMDLKFNNK